LIEADANSPGYAATAPRVVRRELGARIAPSHTGLSHTAYDLLRIGGWALVIVGVLLIILGLMGYWGAQRDARS
jgi:hypothetical protein